MNEIKFRKTKVENIISIWKNDKPHGLIGRIDVLLSEGIIYDSNCSPDSERWLIIDWLVAEESASKGKSVEGKSFDSKQAAKYFVTEILSK